MVLYNSFQIKHEQNQNGDVSVLEPKVYQNMLQEFRVPFPEFFADAEDLRLNFNEFVKNWKELRRSLGLPANKF